MTAMECLIADRSAPVFSEAPDQISSSGAVLRGLLKIHCCQGNFPEELS